MPQRSDFKESFSFQTVPSHSVDDGIYSTHVTLPSNQWHKRGKVAGTRCCTALLAPVTVRTNCCPMASVGKQRSVLSRLHTSSNPAYVWRGELLSSPSELSQAVLTVRIQLCNLKCSQKTEIHTLCCAPDVLTNA